MTKSQKVRLALSSGKNMKVRDHFYAEKIDYQCKGQQLKKTIFKAKNGNLFPKHVQYVLYH